MEISKLTFVGTVEEFAAVAHLFAAAPRPAGRVRIEAAAADQASQVDASELIRRTLKRKPVPPGQQALLRALYHAGEDGLKAPELAEIMGRSEPELAGVLGALGRRINSTPGADITNPPGITLMLDVTPSGERWHYRLRDAVREALEADPPSWLDASREGA